jgi:hypothetical protein
MRVMKGAEFGTPLLSINELRANWRWWIEGRMERVQTGKSAIQQIWKSALRGGASGGDEWV